MRKQSFTFLFLFLSVLMLLIPVIGNHGLSYGQELSKPVQQSGQEENASILKIIEVNVSGTTIAINQTMTISGTIQNEGDYAANNTFLTLSSTNVPTINITQRYPIEPINIGPHESAKFAFEFFPRTDDDLELSVVALPENGSPVKSDLIRISVIEQSTGIQNYTIIGITSAIAAAGAGAAVWLYWRRNLRTGTRS